MIKYKHTSDDRIPFTYLIGWSKYNIWYYGAKYSKNCKPQDLWTKYFTSSKHVFEFRQNNGEPDIIEIRKIFSSKEKCVLWESNVLCKIDAAKRTDFLNKRNGFKTAAMNVGFSVFIDKNGNKIRTSNDDLRVISGELVPRSKGFSNFRNENGEIFYVSKDDVRVLSGELFGITKGFGVYRNIKTGETVQTFSDDIRVLSGELVGYTVGMSLYKNIYTGEKVYTSKNDSRVLSGELVGHRKGISGYKLNYKNRGDVK